MADPIHPDPFAPPASWSAPERLQNTDLALATRGARFFARCVDGVAAALISAPIGIGWLFLTEPNLDDPESVVLFYALIGVPYLAQAIVQWYLIATTGQTIGKMLLGIRIVRLDGSPVDFWSGVVMRDWVLGVLNAFCGFVSFVDALAILSVDRRCIHDHLARTVVIEA